MRTHDDRAHPSLAECEDAVSRMPRGLRILFLQMVVDDLTAAEIAERRAWSVETTEHLLTQALGNYIRNLENPRRGR